MLYITFSQMQNTMPEQKSAGTPFTVTACSFGVAQSLAPEFIPGWAWQTWQETVSTVFSAREILRSYVLSGGS
jgi:hypothetical protein